MLLHLYISAILKHLLAVALTSLESLSLYQNVSPPLFIIHFRILWFFCTVITDSGQILPNKLAPDKKKVASQKLALQTLLKGPFLILRYLAAVY